MTLLGCVIGIAGLALADFILGPLDDQQGNYVMCVRQTGEVTGHPDDMESGCPAGSTEAVFNDEGERADSLSAPTGESYPPFVVLLYFTVIVSISIGLVATGAISYVKPPRVSGQRNPAGY